MPVRYLVVFKKIVDIWTNKKLSSNENNVIYRNFRHNYFYRIFF